MQKSLVSVSEVTGFWVTGWQGWQGILKIYSRAGRQEKSGRKFLPARVRGEKLKNSCHRVTLSPWNRMKPVGIGWTDGLGTARRGHHHRIAASWCRRIPGKPWFPRQYGRLPCTHGCAWCASFRIRDHWKLCPTWYYSASERCCNWWSASLWLWTRTPLSPPPLAFGSRDPYITIFVATPPK